MALTRSEGQQANLRKRNGWKWAFIGAVAVIIALFAYVLFLCAAPLKSSSEAPALKTNATTFDVKLTSTQVNALADNYLTGQKQSYKFYVGKQYATVSGNTKFLGAKIAFAVNFVPTQDSAGNVILKAKGLSVGRLNLPVSYVLGYINKHNSLPSWISINQHKKTVLLDLNKYSKGKSVHYSAKTIDLKHQKFVIAITVPRK